MQQHVTIVQIAKECQVSIATVSRVMNGTAPVSAEISRRVHDAIKKHHYTPNAFARSLINRQSMTIGILIPDISNPYFSAMFREFERAAHAFSYSVLLCNTAFSSSNMQREESREIDYFQMMLDKNVDGVLIVGGQADLLQVSEDYKKALSHLSSVIPVVVLGSRIDEVDCMFVQRETGRGVFSAVSYLASLGHKRIAFVGGEDGVGITEARLKAYMDAMHILNLPKEKKLVSLSNYYTPDGYSAMNQLISSGTAFTAFLAMNDNVAMGAYRALADAGLRIPDDVSAISCDQFFSAEYYVPRLTSVDQHNEQFGRFVINVLLGAMKGVKENVKLSFTPELVVRESCASAQAVY